MLGACQTGPERVAWRNYDGAASAFALASDGLGLRGNEAIAGGICEALLKGPSGNEAPYIESRLQARVFELVRNIYAAPKMLNLLDVRATHLATQITVSVWQVVWRTTSMNSSCRFAKRRTRS